MQEGGAFPADRAQSLHETEKTISPPPEETQAGNDKIEDEPPNGGYGWVCVACVAFINAHTWGINSVKLPSPNQARSPKSLIASLESYGIFLSYYLSNEVFPGASYLEYAFVGGLSITAALLISPLATYTTRRFRTRTTLLVGVFFETLSLIGASFATTIWQLFLSQGLCFGIGMGFLFVGSVAIIPQWFTSLRSLANGIGTAGSGLGGMMYSLAAQAMIQSIGLAWAFRILGILAFTVNFVCAILIKDRNTAIGSSQLAFDHHLFKRREFLTMQAWGFFSLFGYVVLLFSLPNYGVSVGLTARQASVIGALLNLGQGIGRPLVGQFSDRLGRINVAAFLTFLCGLLCLVIWIPAKSYGVLIFFAILIGTMAGTIWTTVAPVGAEVVGLRELPSTLSITFVIFAIPSLVSEAIGLELRQVGAGSYLYVQIYTGLMYIVAGICAWFLRAWKIGQLEELPAEQGTCGHGAAEAPASARTSPSARAARKSVLLRRLVMWKSV